MNILLTGASGFLGSALLQSFIGKKHQIKVLLRENSDFSKLPESENYEQVILKDYKNLKDIKLDTFNGYTIVNCGWKGVQGGERNQLWQYKDNLDFMNELLLLIESSNCNHLINFGSHAEYGPLNKKIDEDCKKLPTTAYGRSKNIVHNLAKNYLQEISVKYTHLRIFNIFGPNDHESWFIPYIIKSLILNQSPKLTKCEQKWDYLYIDDFVGAVNEIIETQQVGTFNLGSGKVNPLSYIVSHIEKRVDNGSKAILGEVKYRDDQVMHLEADINRITNSTSWKPLVEIEDGLDKTIEFFIRKYIES